MPGGTIFTFHLFLFLQGIFKEVVTSKGKTSKTLSDISSRLDTCSRSKETQSYDDIPPFEVSMNSWEQLSKPPKGGIIIKDNLVIDEHILSFERSSEETPHPNIMSVMVVFK